jgi:hypothetical protein
MPSPSFKYGAPVKRATVEMEMVYELESIVNSLSNKW